MQRHGDVFSAIGTRSVGLAGPGLVCGGLVARAKARVGAGRDRHLHWNHAFGHVLDFLLRFSACESLINFEVSFSLSPSRPVAAGFLSRQAFSSSRFDSDQLEDRPGGSGSSGRHLSAGVGAAAQRWRAVGGRPVCLVGGGPVEWPGTAVVSVGLHLDWGGGTPVCEVNRIARLT